jgi:cytochrome c5
MSDNSHDSHEAHTGPVKTAKQMLLLSFASFVLPVFIIIGIVYYVTSANKPAAGAVNTEMATALRIQKVGSVEVRDANRPLKSGADVYKVQCAACHDSGAAGAPKFSDTAGWSARLSQGLDGLVSAALNGKGAMGAQSGGDFNDTEIARAVVYLTNSAGSQFAEPAAPEASAESAK